MSGYIKQLDSIRAIAVTLVVISHWFAHTHPLNVFPNGAIGVDIFFVLSGFLITRILFENRSEEGNRLGVIKNFIIRRTLRIFPIYYIFIAAFFIFSSVDKSTLLYYVTYSSNLLFYLQQSWEGISHLWSLAVEEQFYLIWPWLIIYSNRKYFLPLIGSFILIGVLSNYLLPLVLPYKGFIRQLMPASFDAFGLGALLAYVVVYQKEHFGRFKTAAAIGAVTGVGLLIINTFFGVHLLPMRTIHALLALFLICYGLEEKKNFVFRYILNSRVLIFIGKISYGMYLYHGLIPWVWKSQQSVLYRIGFLKDLLSPSLHGEVLFFEEYAFVVLLSWASWKLVEQPFNNLKRYFNYRQEKKAVPAKLLAGKEMAPSGVVS